jgi:hypothetical protein
MLLHSKWGQRSALDRQMAHAKHGYPKSDVWIAIKLQESQAAIGEVVVAKIALAKMKR